MLVEQGVWHPEQAWDARTPGTKTKERGKEGKPALRKAAWPRRICFLVPIGHHCPPSCSPVPRWLWALRDLFVPATDGNRCVLLNAIAARWDGGAEHSTTALCARGCGRGAISCHTNQSIHIVTLHIWGAESHFHQLLPVISFLTFQTFFDSQTEDITSSLITHSLLNVLHFREIRSHQTHSCTTDSTHYGLLPQGIWHRRLYAVNYKIHIKGGNHACSSLWKCGLWGQNETIVEIRCSLIAAHVCLPLVFLFSSLLFLLIASYSSKK